MTRGILFLTANKLQIYLAEDKEIPTFDFAQTFIKDLEVVNKEELTSQLLAFIDKYKIPPMTLIGILADSVLFQTEFPTTQEAKPQSPKDKPTAQAVQTPPQTPEQLLNEIQRFIDAIPFENLSTKTFKIDKGIKVIGTNRDLYESIKQVFESRNFIIDFVAPASIIGKDIASLEALNKDAAKKILQKASILKQHALEIHYEPKDLSTQEPQTTTTQTDKIRLYILIGSFIILLIILVILSINTFVLSTPKKSSMQQTLPPLPQTQKTPTLPQPTLPQATSSASSLSPSTVRIQILNGSGIPNQARTLKDQLTKLGFSDISTSTSVTTDSTQTIIAYNSNVSQNLRDLIVNELNKTYAQVIRQETNNTAFDIVITTGNPL